MFTLKIDKDIMDKVVGGITLKKGDILNLEHMSLDGRTVEHEEKVTLETIKHYNGDLFEVTFKEKLGIYAFTLNQLIHFKVE